MGIGYRELAPDARLAAYVACYWVMDVHAAAGATHRVLPDGCIDLLFDSHAGQLDVVGTMRRAVTVQLCGPADFVAVRFKPGGATPFLRDRADQLTDRRVDCEQLLGRAGPSLRARLAQPARLSARMQRLEGFLLERLPGVAAVESRVAWACQHLNRHAGAGVADLAAELGVSRQYLRRLFLHHTGMSPQRFGRIARLTRAVRALDRASLAGAACAAGYADQAHLTREFRALAGVTPAAYRCEQAHGGQVPSVQDGAATCG